MCMNPAYLICQQDAISLAPAIAPPVVEHGAIEVTACCSMTNAD